MSRVPPPYPHHPHQGPPPPSHPMYYTQQSMQPPPLGQAPPPGPGQLSQYGMPPQDSSGMYHQYSREIPPPPPSASGSRVGWNAGPPPPPNGQPGPPGSIPGHPPPGDVNGYGVPVSNAVAGPSRGEGLPYTHLRTSPTRPGSGPGQQMGAPDQQNGVGWSSIHPTSGQMGQARPDAAPRGSGAAVKLEDLVSHERTRSNAAAGKGSRNDPVESLKNASRRSSTQDVNASGDKGGGKEGPSDFIKKLYGMLEEERATFGKGRAAGKNKRGSVGWKRGGLSFVVWDLNDFTTKVLPQTFRHSNFSSFVRQLNKYGFSKIKHVDEGSGQIKENVWEFQHPSFVAGGESDLESIKRKAVAPKKSAAEGEVEASPTRPTGLNAEDSGRIMDMEQRVRSLEDQLAKALDEVQEVRMREMGYMNVVREIINHLAQADKQNAASPAAQPDGAPSSQIVNLFRAFDQAVSGPTYHPASYPNGGLPFTGSVRTPSGHGMRSAPAGASPMTDGGSHASDGPSPAPSKASGSGRRVSKAPRRSKEKPDETIEAISQQQQAPMQATTQPIAGATTQGMDANATLYNGEPMTMTPVFAEQPAWLTENTPLPPYNGKSSDSTTLRSLVEALSSQNTNDGSQMMQNTGDAMAQTIMADSQPVTGLQAVQADQPMMNVNVNTAIPPQQAQIQEIPQQVNTNVTIPQTQNNGMPDPTTVQANAAQFPNMTFPVPPAVAAQTTTSNSSPETTKETAVARRTSVKPHWTHSPRILVVEDDVVYRQLSAKFLDKFGCVTETVEDAQGAVAKMNQAKYDLVLMDIFFGPSMDGRKATSLIRQFDMYTPIISMTSNVQINDVNSYLQSGMNDVLAKPFTKHGLFGILDKHLIHLKAIQLSAEVPRSLGLPPLSDEGVQDALVTASAQYIQQQDPNMRNPLAAMGWSDETYQLVLQQFIATGNMPDVSAISNGTIGTSIVFADSANFNRKRSIETLEDDWDAATSAAIVSGAVDGTGSSSAATNVNVNNGVGGMSVMNGQNTTMGGDTMPVMSNVQVTNVLSGLDLGAIAAATGGNLNGMAGNGMDMSAASQAGPSANGRTTKKAKKAQA